MGIFLNPYRYPYLEVYKPLYIDLQKEYFHHFRMQSVIMYRPSNVTVVLQYLGVMKYFDLNAPKIQIYIYFSRTYGQYMFRSRLKLLYLSNIISTNELQVNNFNLIKYFGGTNYIDKIIGFVVISQTLSCQIPCFQYLQNFISGLPNKCNDCTGKYDILIYNRCFLNLYRAGSKGNSTIIFGVYNNNCIYTLIITIQPSETYGGNGHQHNMGQSLLWENIQNICYGEKFHHSNTYNLTFGYA